MNDTEQRAHDLALLFLKYKLEIERNKSDAECDEEAIFKMYKSAYDNFYDHIERP